MTPTTCLVCGRAVWDTDRDAEGRCCWCEGRPIHPPSVLPPMERRWRQFETAEAPGVLGWFHHHDALMAMLWDGTPLVAVEVGTFNGASAIPQAKALAVWGGSLVCVDHWDAFPGSFEAFTGHCARLGVSNVEPWRMPSLAGAARWRAEGRPDADWIYIDADHTEAGVRADLSAWWRVLAPGGVILGDDYGNPDFPGVTRAWDAFGADKDQGTSHGLGRWGLVWIRKGTDTATVSVPSLDTIGAVA